MGFTKKRSGGGRFAALLGGIGIGAAAMYVLDPQGGRRRRAIARDKAVSFANKTGRVVGARSRDLANRAKGFAARSTVTGVNGGNGNGARDNSQTDGGRPLEPGNLDESGI
jgi:hypothetical protein